MPITCDVKKTKIGFGTDKKEAYVGRIQMGSTITADKLEEQVAAGGSEVEVEKVRVRWLPSKKVREAAANFAIKKTGDDGNVDIDDDDTTDGGGGTGQGGQEFT